MIPPELPNSCSSTHELITKIAAAKRRLALESYYAFSLIPFKFYHLLAGSHFSLTLSILLYSYLESTNAKSRCMCGLQRYAKHENIGMKFLNSLYNLSLEVDTCILDFCCLQEFLLGCEQAWTQSYTSGALTWIQCKNLNWY